MKERPMLYTGAMVRAVLADAKTMTRRIVKGAPSLVRWNQIVVAGRAGWEDEHGRPIRCPYGQPGDRLWVREAWMPDAPRDGTWPDVQFYGCKDSSLDLIPERYRKPKHCLFKATWDGHELVGWKPSTHMPRWACRLRLEITDIRAERLQDISWEDCIAEGINRIAHGREGYFYHYLNTTPNQHNKCFPDDAYQELWEKLYGAGSWDANPWVWVIEFKKVEA